MDLKTVKWERQCMKGHESKDLIEFVKQRTDIVQVIGGRIKLDRNNKALCPFHEEKTPSFSVNVKVQYFHCFGCGVGGDVIRFIELYEKKSFKEALLGLAGRAGVALSSLSSDEFDKFEEKHALQDILAKTATFYHKSITDEVREYLIEERGFTEDTISRFQIGFANGSLREYLIGKCNLPADLCHKAGVLKKTESGQIKDYFYNRVVFPVIRRGLVVNLSGRTIDGREPKYLHLPGEISYLYNEDALFNKEVYVTEGITDCLSAIQAGYPAVAILGSLSFKTEFLQRFSGCTKIYLCLDGDDAGRQGAEKAAIIIGERARIVELPEGTDLNDYFKAHSKDEFETLLSAAKDIIKYKLNHIPKDTDKTELPNLLAPVLGILAHMDMAKAESYLSYEIKPHFKLKNKDIEAYRKIVNEQRDEDNKLESQHQAKSTEKPKYTALFEGLVDLVEQDDESAFLINDGGKITVVSQAEVSGIVYHPPPKEQIPWLLPRGEEVLKLSEIEKVLPPRESDGALYDDLVAYLKTVSELPGGEYYDLLAAWVLHTYMLEMVQYSPVICLFAVPERGKTRTGKGLIHVAYRGIHVESLRDAYLVRVANNFQSTVFFDVKGMWRKAEKNGTEDILLLRFEKGATVPRVLYPDRGAFNDTVYYSIFGPTIIGTNESVHKILETRAITINMPETSRRFENDVTSESALPLKERLLAFRARHLGETIQNIPKPAGGRLGDILKPLQQIIRLVKPEKEPSFLRMVRELNTDRLIEKSDSLEAQILSKIISIEDQVERGILPVKVITDSFNEGKSEKNQLSYQRIGRRLSAMGFRKVRTNDGAAAIMWDGQKIERMKETYGLSKTSETSERSETSDNPADVTDDTGVTDVSPIPL